ncbi:MAG: hypothetical protein MR922_09610 [Lachnospiraceae bacterium]|nr:hypothetical protein [Lachnospiraceae bacterium]
MANYTQEQWNAKKGELMEKCFDGFAELGLHGTGIRTPAKQKFFKGLNERYTEYAKSLELKLGFLTKKSHRSFSF